MRARSTYFTNQINTELALSKAAAGDTQQGANSIWAFLIEFFSAFTVNRWRRFNSNANSVEFGAKRMKAAIISKNNRPEQRTEKQPIISKQQAHRLQKINIFCCHLYFSTRLSTEIKILFNGSHSTLFSIHNYTKAQIEASDSTLTLGLVISFDAQTQR